MSTTTTPAAETPAATAAPAAAASTPEAVAADKAVVNTAIARLTGRAVETPAAAAAAAPATNEAKPATTTTEAAPATAAAPAAQPAPDASKGANRIRKVTAEAPPAASTPSAEEIAAEVLKQQKAAATAAAPAAVTPAAPALAPEDAQELELARYAAGKKKDRYSDLPERLDAWFKKRDEYLTAKAEELGGAATPEYAEFLESEACKNFFRSNRPGWHRGDRSELERAKIHDDAVSEANKRVQGVERRLERQIQEVKLAPVIENQINTAVDDLLSADDEAIKAYQADPDKAHAEMSIEAKEVEHTAAGLRIIVGEYLKISNDLVDPVAGNPVHDFLDTFIVQQGQQLDSKPEAERTRNGKILVSPGKYDELRKAGKAQGYETFSENDVVTMLTVFTKGILPEKLKGIRGQIEASGYARVKSTASGDAANGGGNAQPASPRAGATRAPGPSETAPAPVPRHVALLTGKKT